MDVMHVMDVMEFLLFGRERLLPYYYLITTCGFRGKSDNKGFIRNTVVKTVAVKSNIISKYLEHYLSSITTIIKQLNANNNMIRDRDG